MIQPILPSCNRPSLKQPDGGDCEPEMNQYKEIELLKSQLRTENTREQNSDITDATFEGCTMMESNSTSPYAITEGYFFESYIADTMLKQLSPF